MSSTALSALQQCLLNCFSFVQVPLSDHGAQSRLHLHTSLCVCVCVCVCVTSSLLLSSHSRPPSSCWQAALMGGRDTENTLRTDTLAEASRQSPHLGHLGSVPPVSCFVCSACNFPPQNAVRLSVADDIIFVVGERGCSHQQWRRGGAAWPRLSRSCVW